MERIAGAERFAANTGATVRHGGDRAYYSITSDHVKMPPFECFRDAESYYATLLHELTHWTRHEKRLDREFGRKRWGDAGYAAEELVAELGSAFLSADLGITAEPSCDHSSYLATWLEVLKNDTAPSSPPPRTRNAPPIICMACSSDRRHSGPLRRRPYLCRCRMGPKATRRPSAFGVGILYILYLTYTQVIEFV